MRERVELIRVSHPYLGPYEADLTSVGQDEEQEHLLLLLIAQDHPPLQIGERLVLTWDGERTKSGRAIVEMINQDTQELDGDWTGVKLSLTMQTEPKNNRHYPRLYGGFDVYYASLLQFDDITGWLDVDCNIDEIKADQRFAKPIDELMNFSVNGLSFETNQPIDQGQQLVCVLGINQVNKPIKCLAKVVRCENLENTYMIALSFMSPPQSLTEVLTDFTLKLQKKEIEGDIDEI